MIRVILGNIFRNLINNRFIYLNFLSGLLLNLIIWLFLFINITPSLEPIPLHYNIYFGIDYFGPSNRIFFLPLLGLLILLVNFFLSLLFYFKEKILSYFLIFSSILVQFLLIVASVFIILLNKQF